jgi:iron complex transport system ATP-binding protein
MMPLLEFEDVVFGYGSGDILNGLNGEIFADDCIAIVGRNGIGKTTLLRLAAGTVVPHTGDVRLKQRGLRSLKQCEIARSIAFVPQNAEIAFPFTVEQFVERGRTLFLRMFGGLGAADREAVERAMALTDT